MAEHLKQILIEDTTGGRKRAIVVTTDGRKLTKSFKGLSHEDIVNGNMHPAQLDDWKAVEEEKPELGADGSGENEPPAEV